MKDFVATAQDRAAALVAAAAETDVKMLPPCQMKGDWVASAAAMALAGKWDMSPMDIAEELVKRIPIEQEGWFDAAEAKRGYVNLRLGPIWYATVAGTPPDDGPIVEDPVDPVPEDFPVEVDPGDWNFLFRMGRGVTPEMVAARDRSNPAWYVRSTAKRMAELAVREGVAFPKEWSEPERDLLRRSAHYVYRCWDPSPALGQYLTRLADTLWKEQERVCGAVKRNCARVLAAGYDQLANEGKPKEESAFPFPPIIPGMPFMG
jgi:hypothetical protein